MGSGLEGVGKYDGERVWKRGRNSGEGGVEGGTRGMLWKTAVKLVRILRGEARMSYGLRSADILGAVDVDYFRTKLLARRRTRGGGFGEAGGILKELGERL